MNQLSGRPRIHSRFQRLPLIVQYWKNTHSLSIRANSLFYPKLVNKHLKIAGLASRPPFTFKQVPRQEIPLNNKFAQWVTPKVFESSSWCVLTNTLSPTSKESIEFWLVEPQITALDPSSLKYGNRTWSLKSRPIPGMIIMSLAKASPVMLINCRASFSVSRILSRSRYH